MRAAAHAYGVAVEVAGADMTLMYDMYVGATSSGNVQVPVAHANVHAGAADVDVDATGDVDRVSELPCAVAEGVTDRGR